MKLTIRYKTQTKDTIRKNIESVSLTRKDLENDSIYVMTKGATHGVYYYLKDMIYFDVEED